MPKVEPFRAWRFDPAVAGDPAACLAPPYDVYDEAQRRAFLASPHSIVHLDSPSGGADPAAADSRYAAAARILADWRRAGVLRRDPTPAIFGYEQIYHWAGETIARRMIIVRLRLEPFGVGGVHPHERTFSGPKEDRFQLTLATRCNLSQPLAFYLDPAGEVAAPLAATFAGEPELDALDPTGVRNRLWTAVDPTLIAAVSDGLAGRDLFIADGHHRYETSLRYLAELEAGAELPDDHPARYVAVVCVGSSDPGLRVMPTHRVVSGLTGFSPQWLTAAAGDFDWRPRVAPPGDLDAVEAALEAASPQAVGVLTRDEFGLLTPRAGEAPRAIVDRSEPLRRLNVTILDDWLRPTYLQPAHGAGSTAYVHRVDEAAVLLAGGADVAFLLRPCPVETIIEVARQRELMPQKSTYFYPKVATGLVIHSLEPDAAG